MLSTGCLLTSVSQCVCCRCSLLHLQQTAGVHFLRLLRLLQLQQIDYTRGLLFNPPICGNLNKYASLDTARIGIFPALRLCDVFTGFFG